MPPIRKTTPPSLWLRLWHGVRWPSLGILLGVVFARLGYYERADFAYFMAREAKTEEVRLGIHKPGVTSGAVRDKLAVDEPKLATEPSIRTVKFYGLEIVTEYAGLGISQRLGGDWYLLPSHWRWRLQCLFGTLGGLLGLAFAQQRAISDLRLQLGRIHHKLFPVENDQTKQSLICPQDDRLTRVEQTLSPDSPAAPT